MSEKRAPRAGAPSHACLVCGTSENTVPFDSGHEACLSCDTEGLCLLKSSHPGSPGIVQPLACFLGRGSCDGVLFYSRTRAVLRRILPQPRPSVTTAPDGDPPPSAEAAAPTADSDAGAAKADPRLEAAAPESAAPNSANTG
jgi:hypothetical protein